MARRGRKPKRVELPQAEVERYRQGGISLQELARRAGVPVTTAYRELRRRGVDTSPRRRAGPPDDRALQAAALYRQGLSLRAVAARLGLSAEGVRPLLRRAGVAPRGPGTRYPLGAGAGARRRFAARLRSLRRAAGLTQAALAARAGLHPLTVWKLENALRGPTRQTVDRLCAALGVAPGALGVPGPRPA